MGEGGGFAAALLLQEFIKVIVHTCGGIYSNSGGGGR